MKNKHGIEIRVEQIFKDECCRYWIVGFDDFNYNQEIICGFCDGDSSGYDCYSIDTINNLSLISCPVLGDMADWDIVTEQQKGDYNKPKEAQLFDGEWWDCDSIHSSWVSCIYRVPRGFDWEPYRKDRPTEPAHVYGGPCLSCGDRHIGACKTAPIEHIEIYHCIDTTEPHSIRQAFEDYEDKINEIIEWIKEQG